MDINNLYTQDLHDEGAEMQVKDAEGNPLDCFITLVGVDSKRWRDLLRGQQRKLQAGGYDADGAGLLAGATLSWRGFTANGEDLPFSKEAAALLYEKAPYIAQQVDLFIANRTNFTRS